jgi:hypothetical protein
MSARRFPRLVVMRTTGIDDLSGMLPAGFDLAQVCDDDLIPGTKTSSLLRDACNDFYREAAGISRAALGDGLKPASGPFLSVLPRLTGAEFEIVLAWQVAGGVTFVASSVRLPHLFQDDAEFAGHDPSGRIVYFGKVSDLPVAA